MYFGAVSTQVFLFSWIICIPHSLILSTMFFFFVDSACLLLLPLCTPHLVYTYHCFAQCISLYLFLFSSISLQIQNFIVQLFFRSILLESIYFRFFLLFLLFYCCFISLFHSVRVFVIAFVLVFIKQNRTRTRTSSSLAPIRRWWWYMAIVATGSSNLMLTIFVIPNKLRKNSVIFLANKNNNHTTNIDTNTNLRKTRSVNNNKNGTHFHNYH